MKFINNMKLLITMGLLLQVGMSLADNNDWALQGQSILNKIDSFSSKSSESNSKLIEAAENNNLKELQKALNDSKANINEISTKSGMTALMHACRNGREDMVILLLDKGANPSIQNSWGR